MSDWDLSGIGIELGELTSPDLPTSENPFDTGVFNEIKTLLISEFNNLQRLKLFVTVILS